MKSIEEKIENRIKDNPFFQFLGEDNMTIDKLMDLNKKWAIENGLCEDGE